MAGKFSSRRVRILSKKNPPRGATDSIDGGDDWTVGTFHIFKSFEQHRRSGIGTSGLCIDGIMKSSQDVEAEVRRCGQSDIDLLIL